MKKALRSALSLLLICVAFTGYAQKVNFSGRILFSHDRMEPNFKIDYYVDGSTTPTVSDKDRKDYQEDAKFWTEVYISPEAKSLKIVITADGYEPFEVNVANVHFNEAGYLKVMYNSNNFIKMKPLNIPKIADIKYRSSADYSRHFMFITLYNPLTEDARFTDIKMHSKGKYESGLVCLVPTPDADLYSISDKVPVAVLKDSVMFLNSDEDSAKFSLIQDASCTTDGNISINICDHTRMIDYTIHVPSGITVAPGKYTTIRVSVPEFLKMEHIYNKETKDIQINTGISSFDRYYFTLSGDKKQVSTAGNYKPPYDKEGMKGYFLKREKLLTAPENKVK